MSIHAIPAVEDAVDCTTATGEVCAPGPQCQDCAPLSSNRPSDELILRHLGAAVLLCWAQLPLGTKDQILRQADDVIGLTPIPQVRNEIVKLLLRHAKAQWAASLLSVRGSVNPDLSVQSSSKPPAASEPA